MRSALAAANHVARTGRNRYAPGVRLWSTAAAVICVALIAAACGGGDDSGDDSAPVVIATTGIWADVVANATCNELVQVQSVIPVGGDPHGYEASLQDRGRMDDAALVVANGLDLEEGLLDTLDAVAQAGTPVFEIADGVDTIAYGEDDDHDHGHDHGHGSEDPHIWQDPQRVAGALPGLGEALTTHAGLDGAEVNACIDAYVAELEALDAEIAAAVANIPESNRKLITNHEALGYFADRYGLEVIGTVIPSPSSQSEPSPALLEELAETIDDLQLPAIFSEHLEAGDDIGTLADYIGDVELVTLYTGSLGQAGSGADTLVGMLRTNAGLISDALG